MRWSLSLSNRLSSIFRSDAVDTEKCVFYDSRRRKRQRHAIQVKVVETIVFVPATLGSELKGRAPITG